MQRPELLGTFDFLGNRLDRGGWLKREKSRAENFWGPTSGAFGMGRGEDVQAYVSADPAQRRDDPANWERFSPIRKHVRKVGAEGGWEDVAVPSHRSRVAFDEPALAIVGMWRQETGADPHFALALGETMLRVRQRYVAWCAFERAALLAERFWPDEAVCHALREHCRKRQGQIEESLSRERAGDVLRPTFEAELAYGEAYQREYQRYEEEKIAAGASIDDPKFYDDFHAGREPIASVPGKEEWHVSRKSLLAHVAAIRWRWAGIGAVLAALAAASLCWLASRRLPPEDLRQEVQDRHDADGDQPIQDVIAGRPARLGRDEPVVDHQGDHDADEGDADEPA
jgi:hypothetical protein